MFRLKKANDIEVMDDYLCQYNINTRQIIDTTVDRSWFEN